MEQGLLLEAVLFTAIAESFDVAHGDEGGGALLGEFHWRFALRLQQLVDHSGQVERRVEERKKFMKG